MATSPNTIPSYSGPDLPLDGTEDYAAWQNGRQRSISGGQLAQFLLAGIGKPTDQAAVAADLSRQLAALSAAQTQVALAIQNSLPTIVAAGDALPFEVTGISGGIGTGAGGTPGEYALGIVGGPSGHQAFVTIGADGKVASYRNANPGLSKANGVPVYSFANVPNLAGATVPTAIVGIIPSGRVFAAPNGDGSQMLSWGNNNGALAAAPFGGPQAVFYGLAPTIGAEVQAGVSGSKAVTPKALADALLVPIFPDDGGGSGDFDTSLYPIRQYQADGTIRPGYEDLTPFVAADAALRLMSPSQTVPIAAPRGTIRGHRLRSTNVDWVDEVTAGNFERRSFNLAGIRKAFDPNAITRVILVLMTGQSLSIGTNAAGAITKAPPFPGRALMPNGGVRVVQGAVGQTGTTPNILNDAQMAQLVDLYETVDSTNSNFGETHGGGIATALVPNLAANEVMVFATVGVGGAKLSQIDVGTYPFINMMRVAEKVAAWCKLHGLTLEIPYVLYDQGESDYPNDNDTPVLAYQAEWIGLQAGTELGLQGVLARAGQVVPARIPFAFWQPSSWCVYGNTAGSTHYNGNVSAIQLATAIANPTKFRPLGPQYWSAYGADGLHETKESYRNCGERDGLDIARFRAGLGSKALYVSGIANVGPTITLTTTATSALVRDTALVTDPGQYGIHLFDAGGNEIALSNVQPSGATTIVATAPAALTPGQSYTVKIGMQTFEGTREAPYPAVAAGPTTGPRTCFRDSDPTLSSAAIGSVHLYNWLMHQKLSFNAV